MADTKATMGNQKQGKSPPNEAARDIPKQIQPEQIQPERIQPEAESSKDKGQHLKAVRDLIQNLRNRGDQDNNKVLDNITMHLDAIDPQEEA